MLLTPPPSPTFACKSTPQDRLGQILLDRIQLSHVLGVGSYGVVYKALDIFTGATYAVKALNKFGLDPRQRQFQQREIQLHHEASRHLNVVSVFQILDCADCTFVILEYCPEGDLFINITEKCLYQGNDGLAKRVFLQILDAVEFCHSIGIYHRDLKPENVLVTDGGLTVKLADFGLATTDHISSDFGCGSTFYMSPECQLPTPRPFSSYATGPNDVWSLGVILINLTCSRNPWKQASPEDSSFKAFLHDPEFLQSILPLSDELGHILRRIFECDPNERISISELRNMVSACSEFTTASPSSLPTTPPPEIEVLHEQFIPESPVSSVNGCGFNSPVNFDPFIARSGPPSPFDASGDGSELYSYQHYPASSRSSLDSQPHLKPSTTTSCAPQYTVASTQPKISSPSNSWYASIMPALDIAQKHMSIHPILPSFRFF